MSETEFTATVNGVEVIVRGDYDAPDRDCNWPGGFDINKVWIETDLQATDIQDLLSDSVIRQLEHEGFTGTAQSIIDAREEAKEHHYDMLRDEAACAELDRREKAARGIA
jgi:hypothetical protein